MKKTTRLIMLALARGRMGDARTRPERAAFLRSLRDIRGGRAALRDTYLTNRNRPAPDRRRPCPACGRAYEPSLIPPPRVPLDIRCACCCQ